MAPLRQVPKRAAGKDAGLSQSGLRIAYTSLMTAASSQPAGFSILGLDHVVLRVADLDRAGAFYCGVLGCTKERTVDSLGLVQLRAGRQLIDLVDVNGELGKKHGTPPAEDGHNMDHVCLRVDRFDEAHLRSYLTENGVPIGDVGRRYGADGYGPSVYITDPDGNTVELKGPPEPEDS